MRFGGDRDISNVFERYCTPTGDIYVDPQGNAYPTYTNCPFWLDPFLAPVPEDLPEIELPTGNPGGGENITDDPEEGITVGPVVPPEQTLPEPTPEAGELAGEAGEPTPTPDFPQPHETVRQRIEENVQSSDDCTDGCDECEPRLEGYYDWNNYLNAGITEAETQEGNYAWVGYQVYVCNLPIDPGRGRIAEFIYLTNDAGQPHEWDGFDAPTCTLIQAKYAYDTALTAEWTPRTGSDGQPDTGSIVVPIEAKRFQAEVTFDELLRKAGNQFRRIANVEHAKLLWVFESHNSFHYFIRRGGDRIGPIPKYDVMQNPWQRS
nr:Tox-REase-5 domain-containing protein [Actibacterium sp. 188UL27-1]